MKRLLRQALASFAGSFLLLGTTAGGAALAADTGAHQPKTSLRPAAHWMRIIKDELKSAGYKDSGVGTQIFDPTTLYVLERVESLNRSPGASEWNYVLEATSLLAGTNGTSSNATPMPSKSIMTLQADLRLLGYMNVGFVDGINGPETQRALNAFQKAHHLTESTVPDKQTWTAILAALKKTAASSPSSKPLERAVLKNPSPVASDSQMIDGHPVLRVLHLIATAYGPSLKDNYPYGPVDYYGQPLQSGMVAVDPRVIPLKTPVYVQGYHDASLPQGGFLGRAMDTGGAIQGPRIDIYMNANPQTVSNFGVQPVTVYVLGN